MTDQIDENPRYVVIAALPLPIINPGRMIWQPVSEMRGPPPWPAPTMKLARLDWQPSGAHHALEFLARQCELLEAEIARLTAERNAAEDRGAERMRRSAAVRSELKAHVVGVDRMAANQIADAIRALPLRETPEGGAA